MAQFEDAAALTEAFRGAEGVFVMLPPNIAPSPDFAEARAVIEAVRSALEATQPAKVVALSSIGSEQESGLG